MKTFEEFDTTSENEFEIIDSMKIGDHMSLNTTLGEIYQIFLRLENKTISFTHKGKITKCYVTDIEITLNNHGNYGLTFWSHDDKYPVEVTQKIEIWGKRVKSDIDPYGEEEWD